MIALGDRECLASVLAQRFQHPPRPHHHFGVSLGVEIVQTRTVQPRRGTHFPCSPTGVRWPGSTGPTSRWGLTPAHMAFRILVALTVTAGAVPTTLDPVVPIFCMITSVASHKAVSRCKILLPFSRYGPRRPAAVTAGDGDGNISIYGAWGLIIETSGLMVYAGDRPPASRAWRRCLPCCPSRYPVC